MENEEKAKETKFLKKKKKNKWSEFLADKKKRALFIAIAILPFFIAVIVFSSVIYAEAKELLSLAKGDEYTEIKDENSIPSMSYVLRNNATDVQKEYFVELKNAVEVEDASSTDIAGLVAKNFVADYFTWTNKQGQYDVGGLCYVYSSKNENVKFKENLYLKSRDSFYKYLNYYMDKYGSSNLLEVSEVEVVESRKEDYQYIIYEASQYVQNSEGEWYWIYEDSNFDCYYVTCSWKYKENATFDTSKFITKLNFLIIKRNGIFEIAEISESPIDYKKIDEIYEQQKNGQETEETESTEQQSDEE